MPTIKDAIEKPKRIELQEQLNKNKEEIMNSLRKLGFDEVQFDEIKSLPIEITEDQYKVDELLKIKEEAQLLSEEMDNLLSDEELMENFQVTQEHLEKVINRICLLSQSGEQLRADLLESHLAERTKGKIKKSTLQREVTKKMQSLYPEKYNYEFEVLGYKGKQSRVISIWNKKKIHEISARGMSNYDDLKLIFGEDYDFEQLRKYIVKEAHKKGQISDYRELKNGIWKIGKGWLVVSGGDFLNIKNSNETKLLSSPIYEEHIILCESKWLCINSLKNNLQEPNDKLEQLKNVFSELLEYIKQWNFVHESMAEYLTVFVILTLVQSAMTWRPWLYLRGPPGSGKSTLIEVIFEAFFGGQLKKLDKTTAYCIAQSIGNTTKALVLDEFEKNERNPEILENCKLMNKGGNKTLGTLEEKEKTYSFCHMPWFASIYTPMTVISDQAQRDRFIFFELRKERKSFILKPISAEKGKDLQIKAIASLISCWELIEDKANEIKRNTETIIKERNNKINYRTVENFQYASAMLSMISGEEHSVPDWAEQEQVSDGKYILDLIVDSRITESGKTYSVGDLINYITEKDQEIEGLHTRKQAKALLEKYGLKVSDGSEEGNGERYYFGIHCAEVQKAFLKRFEEFKDCSIKPALLQIEGAEEGQLRFSSRQRRCIKIPLSHVDN